MSLSEEYNVSQRSPVLFDISNEYGRLFAHGRDTIDLLHRMSTNDLKPLETTNNISALTALTNEKGRIVDVLRIVRDGFGKTLVITGHDKEQAVIQWLDKFTIMEDARFEAATEKIAQYFIGGPEADSVISKYANINAASNSHVYGVNIAGQNATLFKGSSVASYGWSILTLQQSAEMVWNELRREVLAISGVVGDRELYEVLRIEQGIPIVPNELNEKHNPLETPLAAQTVSFTKGCYIGQEVIARLDAQDKVQRKLVGLKFLGEPPHVGDRIATQEPTNNPLGDEIGDVTSVVNSPAHGIIGLGYVRGKYAVAGTIVSIRPSEGSATVVHLPFTANK